MAQRSSLPVHQHANIDSSLKALRGASRYLIPLCASFGDETRILERLYYKSKNQHRSALFWRKVVELRRIGLRISRLDVGACVEGLRASFHSSEGGKINKSAAWSQVPSTKYVASVLHRMWDASCLIAKARGVFMAAYQSFEMLVQSSTFLPLALALVALTSRMDMLTAEMEGSIKTIWPVMLAVADVLGCKHSCPHEIFGDRSERHALPEPVPATVSPLATTLLGEDIGQSISRHSIMPTKIPNPNAPTSRPYTELPPPASPPIIERPTSDIDIGMESHPPPSSGSSDNRSPVPIVTSSSELRPSPPPPPPSQTPLPFVEGSKRKFKPAPKKENRHKRRERDEIDDIFGD